MKYIKNFSVLNESTKFLQFKDILDTIDDICIDVKDEGFDIVFGTMPHGVQEKNFDTNLDDIQIKLASLGKETLFVKFDISKNLDNFEKESTLNIFIETFISVYNYLISEDIIISGFWSKELVVVNRSDYGKTKYFFYENFNEVLNQIDWLRKEKIDNMFSRIDNMKIKKDYSFRQLEDVRIAFTGKSLETYEVH